MTRFAFHTKSTRRAFSAILALSVVLRLGSALYQGNEIRPLPGVTDQISYHELAQRVIAGHGFSFGTGWWPATRANEPTAHWSYLYVLFLAAVYTVFGPAPLAARIIQALIAGLLHPLLAFRIGRRVYGETIGLVAALLTSVYGYFVFYGGSLVTESLYFVAVLWAIDRALALGTSGGTDRGLRRWALLGLACGLSALLRQAFILVLPVVFGWLAWRLLHERGGAKMPAVVRSLSIRFAVSVAVLALCIAPWTVRNYRAFGSFVLLNTNAGFVFFWANHPIHGTEFIPILPNGPVNYGSLIPRELKALNEADLDRALFARAIGFVRDDPARYARLSLSRAREYFKFWPSADSGLTSNVVRVLSFGLLAPFLLAGTLLSLARLRGRAAADGGELLLLLLAAVYSLVHLLTWTLVRYRLPVDAMLMPVAALALVGFWDRVRLASRVPAVHEPKVVS